MATTLTYNEDEIVILTKKKYNEIMEKLKIADEILTGRNDFAYFNKETIDAIEECERNLKDPNRKRYSSIAELKEAMENDNIS